MIPMQNLEAFDKHLQVCSLSFPAQCQASSLQFLDPRFLSSVLTLQDIKLSLHKHNLRPGCPAEVRHAAFKHCLSIAHDTARLVSRCHPPDSAANPAVINDSKSLIATSASNVVCTHLWRCILFLLFCEDYHGALLCIQILTLASDTKAIKTVFARNIRSFLENLLRKVQNQKGGSGIVPTEDDLLAQVIGDVPTTPEGNTNAMTSSNPSLSASRSVSVSQSLTPDVSAASIADSERSWAEWEWIERTVLFLYEQQQARSQGSVQSSLHQSDNHAMITHSSASRQSEDSRMAYRTASSEMQSPGERAGSSNMSGGTTSRMAIASII